MLTEGPGAADLPAPLTRRELARLRAIHLGRWAAALVHAGEYALRRFDPGWRPLIEASLAYWRGSQPALPLREAGGYVDYVIDLSARSV